MEDNKIDFAETVIVIDSAQINNITISKDVFEKLANRTLGNAMIQPMVTYFALDGGVQPGESEIEVVIIYDTDNNVLINCEPSDLTKELSNVGFKNNVGDFVITSFCTEEIAFRKAMFIETVKILLESKSAKRLILVPLMDEYGEAVTDVCKKNAGKKEVTILHVNDLEPSPAYQTQILLFPIMQAMGIAGEEV